MNLDKLSFSTDTVPYYDDKGNLLDEFRLKTRVTPVQYRRTSFGEDGLLYKGTGIIYTGHIVYDLPKGNPNIQLLAKDASPYDRYSIINTKILNKFGIFNFRHQPCFSDHSGGCGKKEQNIIPMQKIFARSAIEEIVDVISVSIPEHYIYSFRLKDLKGSYKDTIDLIEYILLSDFNTAWDKNLWSDVHCFGYIRDIADWFISKEFRHKLGTVYALLNGLSKDDKYTYSNVIHALTGLSQLPKSHMIYLSALIVKKFCPDCVTLDLLSPTKELYTTLFEELYSGKACCHLENDEEWDFVREIYKSTIPESVKVAENTLLRQQIANMTYFM